MPPIRIDTPSGPIWIDPVTGDIVPDPSGSSAGTSLDSGPQGAYPPHYGLAGPSQLSGQTATTTGPTTTAAAGPSGTPRVINVTNLGGGRYQYEYADGTYEVIDLNADSGDGGVSATTAYSQQQQNARAAADLAEQQRQFDLAQRQRQSELVENIGFDKAKFNIQQQYQEAEDARQRELSKGNTLLGLGSRPDTLIKYLYALQGQQTPQGIQNTTANLPGYQNVLGPTNYGAPVAGSTPLASTQNNPANPLAGTNTAFGGSPTTAETALINGVKVWAGGPYSGQPVASTPANAGDLTPYLKNPALAAPTDSAAGGTLGPSTVQTAPSAATTSAQSDLLAAGRKPKFYSDGVAIFKHGGPIPEHVIGVGLKSGKTYEFGEAGPEFVIPNEKVKAMMTLFGKSMKDEHGTQDMMGNKSYAAGGTIDYSQTPTLGQNSSSFFNDPNLRNVVQRGYNSNPGVPLFPQIGLATNQGQSLVPSQQRLGALLPSEQSLYAGALQDEFGAQPEDVFAMARRLAPQVSGLRTPRFAN